MTLLLIYFFIVVLVSFVCSLFESVILSVSPAYIALRVKEGKRSGLILEKLKANVDQPLAAILSLNTIANTVGATGVGAQTFKIYGDEYMALASGVLTFTILVFSEIIPKSLGARHWKKFAPVCAYGIKGLIFLTYPFVILSNILYRLMQTKEGQKTSREEMIMTAEIGASEGSIRKKESTIIRNLLLLDTIQVSEIMTPRSVMTAFNENDKVGHIMEKYKPIRFSRIPLYEGDLDNIAGLLHRYKLMEAVSHDLENLALSELMVTVHSVPESISVSAALDQFIKRQEHLFIVIDEYGSTAGIVTLEDAIETLLGVEIIDESDDVADMRQYALEQWRKKKERVKG